MNHIHCIVGAHEIVIVTGGRCVTLSWDGLSDTEIARIAAIVMVALSVVTTNLPGQLQDTADTIAAKLRQTRV